MTVVAALLAPEGCPWDRAQTLESLRPFLLEEAYELHEALGTANLEAVQEELGDVLLQVLLLSAKLSKAGGGTLGTVARRLSQKLVRRHPHVFGEDRKASDAAEAEARWREVKAAESAAASDKAKRSRFSGVPQALPALLLARRSLEKAGASEVPDAAELEGSLARLLSLTKPASAELWGAHLLSLVRLAGAQGVDAEAALRDAVGQLQEAYDAEGA